MPDNKSLSSSDNNPLQVLQQFTNARIALGCTGISLPVKANLDFQLAHAQARDAVSIPLDFNALTQHISECYATIQLQSQVTSHPEYLKRPDKGRLLNAASVEKFESLQAKDDQPDIVIIVADGLSSKAIENHAPALLNKLLPELQKSAYSVAPICLVKYGRVAIGDPIGGIANARMSVVLIGERPGLSSPDSMGIYFTYHPLVGNTDAQRNCISNIHSQGLNYQVAINKLMFLVNEADRLSFSGVNLKDKTEDESTIKNHLRHSNFLLE